MTIIKIIQNLHLLKVKKPLTISTFVTRLHMLCGRESSSTPYLIKSPYEEVKTSCKSLTEFIWKDVDKWNNHTAIVSILVLHS